MNTPSLDERFNLIDEYLAADNKADACTAFCECAREDEQMAAAFIRYLLLTDRHPSAEMLLEAANSEQTPWMQAARCMMALSVGDAYAARKYASAAIAGGVDEDIIYDSIAQTMESIGLYHQALVYYLLAQRSDESLERILRIISLLLKEEEYDLIESLLSSVPADDYSSVVLPIKIMVACARQDQAAAESLSAAMDPEESLLTAAASLQMQMLYGGENIASLAQEFAELELPQSDLLAADAFIHLGDKEQAKPILDRIASSDIVRAEDLFHLGHRYQRIECWNEAMAAFERADDNSMPYKYHFLIAAERALCLSKTGRSSEALGLYRQLLTDIRSAMLNGYTDTDLYLIQLRCHKALGNKEKVQEIYEFACSIAADDNTRELLRKAIEN